MRLDRWGDNAADPATGARLTAIVASGITGRGPSSLCEPEIWARALALMDGKEKVAIVSGFFVPAVSAPETDGPPGALVLARALLSLGRDVEIWTDSRCLGCMRGGARALGIQEERVADVSDTTSGVQMPDLLIYLERLGRAGDGAYYNMRGEDISRWTPPLDSFALRGDVPVLAIGDGGNEVGMGSLFEPLSAMMPQYAPCLCVVPADVCLPVDVSNWGGYALAALLSRTAGRWLGQTDEEEIALLETLIACGAVDGVSREPRVSVDGLGPEEHLRIRRELQALCAPDAGESVGFGRS